MGWVLLAAAIAFEVFATSMMKFSDGFTKVVPTAATAVGYIVSFALLAQVVKTIPVSVAYAVWSGAGTAAIVAIGAMFLGEPLSVVKVVGVGLIVAGVVTLNVGGAAH